MDRGAHAGAQVGGARVDVSKLGGDLEVLAGLGLHRVTDGLDAAGQALEHTLQCNDGLDETSKSQGGNSIG